MHAAYQGLSPAMQVFLEPLTASHSPVAAIERTNAPTSYRVPDELRTREPVSHPVITVNPRTGRKMLFVNSAWTIAIDGLTKAESDRILAMLFAHIGSPEYQLRYRWQRFDVAFWDNHAVQHFAVPDYTSRRLMQAVRLDGAPPAGVA
jgi:taurine dioxygenase